MTEPPAQSGPTPGRSDLDRNWRSRPAPVPAPKPTLNAWQPMHPASASMPPTRTPATIPPKTAWALPTTTTTLLHPSTTQYPSIGENLKKNGSRDLPASRKPLKKRKPTLQTMSLGDVLPKNILSKATAPTAGPSPPAPAPPPTSIPPISGWATSTAVGALSALSPQEFPALASSSSSALTVASTAAAATKPKPPPPVTTKETPPAVATKKKKKHAAAANPPAPRSNASSSAMLPPPPPRSSTGDEHLLLRLAEQGKVLTGVRGRQRLRPRKKQFSALKKRVLQERLQTWRALHPTAPPGDATMTTTHKATTVVLTGFVTLEELQDDDEYQEIVENLQEMAAKIGATQQIWVPRSPLGDGRCFVDFVLAEDAQAAVACWHQLVVGGQPLQVHCKAGTRPDDQEAWHTWCFTKEPSSEGVVMDDAECATEVALENALTKDDLEDEDCLEETVQDIKSLAEKFGTVVQLRVEREPAPRLIVEYRGSASVAQHAANELGKMVVGGSNISAKVLGGPETAQVGSASGAHCVLLSNVLTEDDLEDEDCLAESLHDIRELAQGFGALQDVRVDSESGASLVRLDYGASIDAARAAWQGFNGMTIGGQTISASMPGTTADDGDAAAPSIAETTSEEKDDAAPGPMFSGNKRIPERFAECKRVPKIPNSGEPRKYATLLDDETVKPLLLETLAELMRLQKRAVEDKNAKARRRIIMGLREVARGIRARKVKMIIMANNLDEYGVIDEKLQEILDSAHEEGVPVFFEFSKRQLGKAVGKSIKVAVVGIQNADGAHQQFKKLQKIAAS